MAYSPIDKPNTHFNPVIYTGTGSAQFITTGFQPDWTWTKIRNTTGNHREQDSVRGTSSELYPNLTNAEDSNILQAITSWTSTGYNIGTDTGINNNGSSYVAWNWKAGGTAVSNTAGDIASSVSANTTSGFSVVSYTGTNSAGATVGHGLGSVPKMIIVKNRDNTPGWGVYHASLGNTKYLQLNATAAEGTASTFWNNTTPTSLVFSIGTSGWMNNSNEDYVAYCFAEKQGYSKFGSYIGNGNADGSFIYTGFKPSFVMWKRTDSAGYDWDMYDTTRDTYNVAFKELIANSSGAESSSTVLSLDILSNGFKLRTSNANGNASGGTYIYMAFAENPLVASNYVPTTAR